jgi:hypothetical protein
MRAKKGQKSKKAVRDEVSCRFGITLSKLIDRHMKERKSPSRTSHKHQNGPSGNGTAMHGVS